MRLSNIMATATLYRTYLIFHTKMRDYDLACASTMSKQGCVYAVTTKRLVRENDSSRADHTAGSTDAAASIDVTYNELHNYCATSRDDVVKGLPSSIKGAARRSR